MFLKFNEINKFTRELYDKYVADNYRNFVDNTKPEDIKYSIILRYLGNHYKRQGIDFVREGLPTEPLIEEGKQIENLAKYFDKHTYIPPEYLKIDPTRKPQYDSLYNLTHPTRYAEDKVEKSEEEQEKDVYSYITDGETKKERWRGEAKEEREAKKKITKWTGKSQGEKLLLAFKKGILDFKPLSPELLKTSLYIPIDFYKNLIPEYRGYTQDKYKEGSYYYETDKFYKGIDEKLLKDFFKKLSFEYYYTFIINAYLLWLQFIHFITEKAYKKARGQLSPPERRANILLFFQRYKQLGRKTIIPFEYDIPIMSRKLGGFWDFKPKQTRRLIMKLIFKDYINKRSKSKLYGDIKRLFTEYLNKQFGSDLIREATAHIKNIKQEDRKLEHRREEEEFGQKGKKIGESKKTTRRTGIHLSLDQEIEGKDESGEEDTYTLKDELPSLPEIKFKLWEIVKHWVDCICPKELREIARLWFGVYKANKYEPINLKVEQIAQQVGKERRRVGEDIDKIEKKVRAYFKKHELYPYYKSLRTPYLE
jgi:hypothetical protein